MKKRLYINGKVEEYETELIPLDKLYFNDLNGRIATYIEEYNDNPKNEKLDSLILKDNKEKYNDLIAKFIKESSNDNEKSYQNTKKDISQKGQINPGVVLSDGRIIDGNRRFTAIRELYKDTGDPKFQYFEAVRLPGNLSKKDIKTLELWLQFNEDKKKEYNKIDFLVSLYNDVINEKTKQFDDKQYIRASGIKESDYKKDINIIDTMIDYLNWRNMPKAFYILKKEKLDGPLEEISRIRGKLSEEEWNSKKDPLYFQITLVDTGDRTRDIRPLVDSAMKNGSLFKKFADTIGTPEKNMQLSMAVVNKNKKPQSPDESKAISSQLNSAQSLLVNSFKDARYESDVIDAYNEPLKLLDAIITRINKIDIDLINKMSLDQKNKVTAKINDVEALLSNIKKIL